LAPVPAATQPSPVRTQRDRVAETHPSVITGATTVTGATRARAEAIDTIQATEGNRAVARFVSSLPRTSGPRRLSRKLSDSLIQLSWKQGYKDLSKQEQDQIVALVDSGLSFSSGQNAALTTFLLDEKSDKSATGIRAWVKERTKKESLGIIRRPGGIPTTNTYKNAKLEGPTEGGEVVMVTGKWDCEKYVMDLDGIKIPIYKPKTPPDPADGVWPGVSDVLGYFNRVPIVVASKIVAVHLNVKTFPGDEPKAPSDRGFMSAGLSGVMNIHPLPAADWAGTNISVVHETGHVVSQQKWGGPSDARWNAWREAMKTDVVAVSSYAYEGIQEDFADSFALWATAIGTSYESAVRSYIPNRVAILDPMLADAEASAKLHMATAP
jgi:hypothetical protein